MNKDILWFDPSTIAFGYAFLQNGNLISYGKFNPILNYNADTNGDNLSGYMLNNIKTYTMNLFTKFNPNIIGIEDIYSQNIKEYKILSKLQGIIEDTIFNYNKDIKPIFFMAKTIRAHYGLNITKVPSDIEYQKYLIKCEKKGIKPRKRPQKHYKDIFPHINFECYGDYRDSNGKKLKEFDYAKKIVIVDKINQLYNLTLNYNDNDVADAILSATYLNTLNIFEE